MNAQVINWSDIPFVLEVCRQGTLSAAARKLSVTHSTVFRRIETIEKKLGVTLFERQTQGYVMTTEGELFLNIAEELDEGVNKLNRELSGKDLRLSGSIRFTTTDTILQVLSPALTEFATQYPDIQLELIAENRALDLTHRDADIALRPTNHPPDAWIGRSLVSIDHGLFAHKTYWRKNRNLSMKEQKWIGVGESLKNSPMGQLISERAKGTNPSVSANTVLGLRDLAMAQMGITALPSFLVGKNSSLVQMEKPNKKYSVGLWLLIHPDSRRNARIQVFQKFISDVIQNNHLFPGMS